MDTGEIIGSDGLTWPQTTDAWAWAIAWMRLTGNKPEVARDHHSMLGWFANAIMAGYDRAQQQARRAEQEGLSASEAVFGFAGWLTTRPEPVTLGSTHECGVVVELIREFCSRNELPECREDWATRLKSGEIACITCGGAGTVVLGVDGEAVNVIDCPSCPGLA